MEKKKLLLNSKGKALLTEDGKILIAPPNSQEILTKYININANGTYDVREYGYASVNVPIPEGYLKPQGTLTIKDEGTYDVSQYASVNLDIETEQIIVDPSDKEQTFEPSASKYFDKVVVNAMPEGLIIPYGTIDITTTEEVDVGAYKTAKVVDSNLIADNIKKDISILGVTGTYEGEGGSGSTLKKLLDATKNCEYLFQDYQGTNVDDLINYNDTENVEDTSSMFRNNSKLKKAPSLNLSKVKYASEMFYGCKSLTELPNYDTSSVTNFRNFLYTCESLVTVPILNLINSTYNIDMLYYTRKMQNLTLLNIKATIQIGGGTAWGHLLTLDSLVNTLKELVNMGNSLKLTMGNANLEKIANVYVRRTTEGDIPTCLSDNSNIDLAKAPCEICNADDEGAMSIIAYANSKNWTLA